MKKAISLLLALVLCLSLCACGDEKQDVTESLEAERTQLPTLDELLSTAISVNIDSFLKECNENYPKACLNYEGKICVFEGCITEIEKDHIRLGCKYLYLNVYLPIEQIVELQTYQYIQIVGTLENLEYDPYKGAFADVNTAFVSKDTYVKTGIFKVYSTTDGTHPQDPCIVCEDGYDVYFIDIDLRNEQVEHDTKVTVEGKLIDNYYDTMPNHAEYKMIDYVIKEIG